LTVEKFWGGLKREKKATSKGTPVTPGNCKRIYSEGDGNGKR